MCKRVCVCVLHVCVSVLYVYVGSVYVCMWEACMCVCIACVCVRVCVCRNGTKYRRVAKLPNKLVKVCIDLMVRSRLC